MNKKNGWKVATIVLATLVMISVYPEVRVVGFFMQAFGLDVIVIAVGAQLVIAFGMIYRQRILPALLWLNSLCRKVDPFYFIPSRDIVRQCPVMVMHSIPLLVPLCFLLLGQVFLYA